MRTAIFALVLALPAAAGAGDTASVIVDFDRGELSGWIALAAGDVTPFYQEQMRSHLVFGARSPHGSYAFVTIIDNGVERPAPGAGEVASFIQEEVYAHLEPEGFEKGIAEVSVLGKRMDAAVLSFRTRGLSYDVGSGGRPAVVKAVFLPIVLSEGHSRYRNLIFVADFRGDERDLADFDRMCRRLVVPDGRLAVVEPADFEAIRGRLIPGDSQRLTDNDDQGAPPAVGSATQEQPELLGAALANQLRGEASAEERRRLELYAAGDATTPIAAEILDLRRRERIRFETEVLESLIREGLSDEYGKLASRLLGDCIVLGDMQNAVHIAERAEAAGLSVADLACPELGYLVDALVQAGVSAPLSEPGLHRFFSLEAALRCGDLSELLTSRGLPIRDLEEVARQGRDGRWELRRGIAAPPRLALHEGRLLAVSRIDDSRGRLISIEPVPDLTAIVATPFHTSP